MCGRFYVLEDGDITPWIDEANRKMAALTGTGMIHAGEMFPTDVLAVVANGKQQNRGVFPMRWGYTIPDSKRPLINARSETASQKTVFRDSFGCRRCLIPADHYFEWNHLSSCPRTKFAIRPDVKGLFYLAGIYRYVPGSVLPECVILTREPCAEIVSIHNRMPVIFGEEQAESWLRTNSDPERLIHDISYRMVFRQAK